MFAVVRTLRTPDERFHDLPEFPFAPNYCEVSDGDGGALRIAWVQEGPDTADPVLMLHPITGHFLQEDAGEELARHIVAFLRRRAVS